MLDDLNPQVIIVLVAMLAGGVKWLLEKARETGEDQSADPSEFEDLYEEARLEILDRQAKVTPTSEEVAGKLGPAQVVRPPVIPPQRSVPPPVPDQPIHRPQPTPQQFQPQQVKRPTLTAAEQEALARFQAVGTAPPPTQRRSNSRVRQLLSSRSSVRDAVILSEILGAPKGAD